MTSHSALPVQHFPIVAASPGSIASVRFASCKLPIDLPVPTVTLQEFAARFHVLQNLYNLSLSLHLCISADQTLALEQAHFINNRTMEVFRQLPWHVHTAHSAASGSERGVSAAWPGLASAPGSWSGPGSGGSLADAVAAASPPLEQWRRFVYCESALGRVMGEMDHFEVRSRLAAVVRGLASGYS